MPVDKPSSVTRCCHLTIKTALQSSISDSQIRESAGARVPEETNGVILHEAPVGMRKPVLNAANTGIGADAVMLTADSAMFAADVGETIHEVRASILEGRAKRSAIDGVESVKKPQFQRLMWSRGEAGVTPAVSYTETAAPVSGVPDFELKNEVVTDTINKYPELFKIMTPLKADELEKLFTTHPNRPLVTSLVAGIRHGFWPYADTSSENGGAVKHSHQFDEVTIAFLHSQRDAEMSLG